ncbi:hypothetical protein R1flu_006558 [Riccia fluitans]|uniref:Uncharacterized protein n=1 Tax=Riccia fluitans TaxID=41844 RepID=A0ABD1YZ34_9MARC
MQVKFNGEVCEPLDPDSKKRRRTPSTQTLNKCSRELDNTESTKRAKHTEVAANGPDQVSLDQGLAHMPFGDAPADLSPVVDKGKAKIDEGPNTSDEKYHKKLDAAQMKHAMRENIKANRPTGRILAGSEPGQSSRKGSDPGHGQGGMDSPCPPWPTTQVEENADHIHGFVDRMLHDFKIANQERDGLQKWLKEAEKRLKDMEHYMLRLVCWKKKKKDGGEGASHGTIRLI